MKRYFRGRFFVVLVLIVCFLLGFMLAVAVKGHTMPHEQLVGMIVSPIRTGFTWCKNQVTDFVSSIVRYGDLEEENAQLRQQVNDLQKEIDDLHYDKVQNDRYKEMLSISDPSYSFEYVSADVVTVSSDGWTSSVGLNAGTNAGISKGNIVVCEGGLVGKVTEVGLNWATVSTLIDPQISVGAMLLSTGDVGVTEGTLELKAKGQCLVRYLKKDSAVNRGDRVYTSGLGGVYPKGILLGTVSELQYEDNGLSLNLVLNPAVSFGDLKEVLVITNFSEETP
ncbi:MAG: rod shape-determining protein MreC [Clostridia bacterium]|nr:rod shape-determining protein MreC [Clostridia bacterium]